MKLARRARICVMTTLKTVPSRSVCRSREGECILRRSQRNQRYARECTCRVDELPDPVLADNPDADTNEDTLQRGTDVQHRLCTVVEIVNRSRPFGKKICITSTFTYTGLDKCTAFNSSVFANDSGSRLTDVKSTRMTAIKDGVTGGVTLKSPI
jgi:hypothetical protein